MDPAIERTNEQKRALREQVRSQLTQMTPGKRAAGSAQARELLCAQRKWKEAGSILFFAPLPEELDIWPLLVQALSEGKVAALPRFEDQTKNYVVCQVADLNADIALGQFGIREPLDRCGQLALNQLDLVLVPGVAFDLLGRRLGRGKGFYDRLLAVVRGTTCGLAFDEQIVSQIPVASHDVAVNCILTPSRWIELEPRAVLE